MTTDTPIDLDAVRRREQAASPIRSTTEIANNLDLDSILTDAVAHAAELPVDVVDCVGCHIAVTDVPRMAAEIRELRADRDVHALAAEQNAAQLAMVRELDSKEIARLNAEVDRLRAELEQARQQVCVIVTCEGCGETFKQDDITCHFTTLDEARSIADDEDWRFVGDQAYCGMCRLDPHPFVAGDDEVTCQRCDIEEDDHEQDTAAEAVTR